MLGGLGCISLHATAIAAEPALAPLVVSPAQNPAAGPALSPAQQTALDQLVAQEIASARQGGVTSFRGTFTSRRTAAERTAAGLDRLTPKEATQLDARVAGALAALPSVQPTPRAPDPGGLDVRTALPAKIHGSVTLGYGWGAGGDYRFGSIESYYYDPEKRFGVGLAIGTSRGSGCFRY